MPDADGLSTTDATRASLAMLRELAGTRDGPMERHCLRVYDITVELARRRHLEVDLELVLCAAWLHDAGLYPGASTSDTYVRDGRRLAERVLAAFDWPEERLQLVGDTIERHHELRPQWRYGAEVELLRRGDLIDVSQGILRLGLDRAWLADLGRRVPRTGMMREIGRLVAVAARKRPLTLPAIFIRR